MVKKTKKRSNTNIIIFVVSVLTIVLLLTYFEIRSFALRGSNGISRNIKIRNYEYHIELNSNRLVQGESLKMAIILLDRATSKPVIAENLQILITQGQSFGGLKKISSKVVTTGKNGQFNIIHPATGTSFFSIDVTPIEFIKDGAYDDSEDNKLHPEHAKEDLGPTIDFEVLPAFFKYFR